MYSYYIGSTKIIVNDINEAREMVEEFEDKLSPSEEYPKNITDFFFAISADYQNYHNLNPDNWEMVHKK